MKTLTSQIQSNFCLQGGGGRPAVTAASPQNFIKSWWKGVTAFSNVYLPKLFFNKFSEQIKNENFNFMNPVQFLPGGGGGG